jgi:O-antigen/teichoic acid export membrane protein
LSTVDSSPPGEPALVHSVRRGTRVVLAAQVASQLVSLGVLAAMLRLVAREEYGLLGMVLPAVMLPRMAATLGLGMAVMQRNLAHDELSSLFWLNVVWGLVAAAVTAVCGPWLASAYDQPLLAPLCLSLAGATLLVAAANQHQALLERKLLLGPLSAARLLALVCGGFAGIYSARRGAGLWALVAQQYGELIVLAIWVWLLEPWRPGWPQRGAGVSGLLRFSGYYSLSQLVNYLAQNLDKIILPVLLGPRAAGAVGLYSQAFSLMMKPVYVLTAPLTGLMVAGLSQAQADRQTHTAVAARFFRLVSVGLFPCAAGLLVVGPEVMTVLGGREWKAAGWILTALAPALFVQGLVNIAGHVFASAGRSGRLLAASVLLCLLLAQGGLAGFYLGKTYLAGATGDPAIGGALGLAISYSAVMVGVWFVPYLWFCLRTAGLSPAQVLLPLWPAFRAAALMGLVVWGLGLLLPITTLLPAVRLGVLIAAGVAAYGLLARRELVWCWSELAVRATVAPAPQPPAP